MKVDGRHTRSIWLEPDGCRWQRSTSDGCARIRRRVMTDCAAAAEAIRSMLVRGAPLIGATAAYGWRCDADRRLDSALDQACAALVVSGRHDQPEWALDEMRKALAPLPARRAEAAMRWPLYRRAGYRHQQGHRPPWLALIEAARAKKKPGERVNC